MSNMDCIRCGKDVTPSGSWGMSGGKAHHSWDCMHNDFDDMSDSTVEVAVTLPKPPEGFEWSIASSEIYPSRATCYFGQVRIAPPERTVMVEVPEKVARWIVELTKDWEPIPGNFYDIWHEAVRRALAQQQVPSEDVCAFRGCTFLATSLLGGVGPLCDHHDSLIAPKQKLELAQQEEVCDEELPITLIVSNCQRAKGHAGSHSPEKQA